MNIYTLYDNAGKEVFSGTYNEIEMFTGKNNKRLTYFVKNNRTLYGKYKIRVTAKIKKEKKVSVYDGNELVFEGGINDVAKKFHVAYKTVCKYIQIHYKIHKKYRLEVVENIAKYPATYTERKTSIINDYNDMQLVKEPYEYKGTKMILTKDRHGKLIKTTFLPL